MNLFLPGLVQCDVLVKIHVWTTSFAIVIVVAAAKGRIQFSSEQLDKYAGLPRKGKYEQKAPTCSLVASGTASETNGYHES